MNIAFYLPFNPQKKISLNEQLVLELINNIIAEKKKHLFVFICSDKTKFLLPASNNVKTVYFKTRLIKKLWWKFSLPRLLKKINAEIFVGCNTDESLPVSIKQIHLQTHFEKIKSGKFKNAGSLVVLNKASAIAMLAGGVIKKEKVRVLSPAPLSNTKPGSSEENFAVKEKHSGGKEYFFYSSQRLSNENFFELLSAFSHFKKRQQSSFKLLVNAAPNSFIQEKMTTYKYREDVVFVANEENKILPKICAAAYAVLLPFETGDDTVAVMNALHSSVPVITSTSAAITEVFKDAVLTVEKNNSKDIGEKMIRLYTDEDFRSRLIENGKSSAGYNQKLAADQLWQFIQEA